MSKKHLKWAKRILLALIPIAAAAFALFGCGPADEPAEPWYANEKPMAESGYTVAQGVTMYRYTVMEGLNVVQGYEFYRDAIDAMGPGQWLMYHSPDGSSVTVPLEWEGPGR